MVHLRQPQRGKRPPAVINVKRIPGLDRIEANASAIRIGALATLAALIEHPIVRAEYPVLPFTARYMGSPAIRHLATVGGNLCNASPAADLSPVLLVLDAEVGIVGPAGARRLPLDRFFRGPGQTALAPGELARLDRVPSPAAPNGRCATSAWTSVARWTSRSPAWLSRSASTTAALRRRAWRSARWRRRPLRVPAAEAALVEGGLAPAAVERAAELAMAAARPIGDVRATAEYRREMVGALVRRALARG